MNTIFVTVRAVHILLASIWFGVSFFTALYLGPAIQQAGPAGGAVIGAIIRRGFDRIMATIGGVTVLTGAWLFWRLTQGFDSSLMSTRIGMFFTAGGLVGIAAAAVGGGIVGRTSKQLFQLGNDMAKMADAEKAAAGQKVAALRARIEMGSKLLLALLFTAMVLMSVGRYVR
jgi:uncharacterized membrane protein